MKASLALAALTAVLALPAGAASEFDGALRDLAQGTLSAWSEDPALRAAIRAQNARTAGLSQDEIDRLDATWREQTISGGAMIDETLANALSAHLKELKASGKGLYSEIFVTDGRGLNVGQSDVTSDYWQGDEAKWQVPTRSRDIHISEIEFDESTRSYQSQLSLPVIEGGEVIGVITVGISVDQLAELN